MKKTFLTEVPFSRDLEREVLSCLFIDPSIMRKYSICVDHFHIEMCRTLFKILSEFEENQVPFDPALVWMEVVKREWTYQFASKQDFEDLCFCAITATNAGYYCERLEEFRKRRLLFWNLSTSLEKISDGESSDAVKTVLAEKFSQEPKASGAIEASELTEAILKLYDYEPEPPVSTGWPSLDSHFRVKPGELTVITGIPNHGKSNWVNALAVNLARQYDWKIAFYSPEMLPEEEHHIALLKLWIGAPFNEGEHRRMTKGEILDAQKVLGDRFHFLKGDNLSFDELLSQAETIPDLRLIVFDPWNEIRHDYKDQQSETLYISQQLGKLRLFARRNKIHIVIVAHPMKLQRDKTGEYPRPTPYDIAGSAHFRNKADNCLMIWRVVDENVSEIHIQKVRFRRTGTLGIVRLHYDVVTGRYFSII